VNSCRTSPSDLNPILGFYFPLLCKDQEFILYRGKSNLAPPVLVLSPALQHPVPESLNRLQHEYSLKEELDSNWAAQPIAMVRHWDRPVLLLTDPGGVPLSQLLGRPEEHPVTLFLDDLQWLDLATLNFIEHLLTDPDVKYLLILGAYRDHEVSPSHPLMLTLTSIRKAGVTVDKIVLKPLSFKDVNHFVSDALRCERVRAEALSRLVRKKTAGNPFFVIQSDPLGSLGSHPCWSGLTPERFL